MEEIRKKFPVPPGFSALLESLAREVLRFQPDDIYTFSALYFDVLLQLRSKYPTVDILANPAIYEKLKTNLMQMAKSHTVTVRPNVLIEASHNSPHGTDDVAASKIQAGVRGFLTRKHLEAAGLPVHHPHQHSVSPKPQTDPSGEGKENEGKPDLAATKIQAGVRGFLTRKRLEHQGKMPKSHLPKGRKGSKKGRKSTQPENDKRPESPDLAAIKIQAGVRGFLVRKRLEHQKAAATKIEAEFRGHLARQEFLREKQAAIKIQSTFRGYKTRKAVLPKLKKPKVDDD